MKFFTSILKRKWLTGIIVIALLSGGFWSYKKITTKASPTKYITAAVEKGTLIVSVSGTGQVSSSNQIDIKAASLGKITKVLAQASQEVDTNTVLAQIDAQDALKTLRDAEVNVATAKLALEKLERPTDTLTLLQAQNSLSSAKDALVKLKLSDQTDLQKAQETKQKAQDTIAKAYEDSSNTIANTFLDLPTSISKLEDILYSYDIGKTEPTIGTGSWNIGALRISSDPGDRDKIQLFITSAEDDYKTARAKYDKNFTDYKNASRYSDQATIESLMSETLDTTKAITQSAKSTSNLLDTWVDLRSQRGNPIFAKVKEYQANVSTYISQANTHLSAMLSQQSTLQDAKQAIINADRDITQMQQNQPIDITAAEQSIKEKEASLNKLAAGPDTLDVQSQQLAVEQRENALRDAQSKLADYTIKAPLAGIIAKVNAKVGDEASSGTALFTIVAKQQIAEISLNEVDVAKIKPGQKATLSFDAIPDLNITGSVAEIDTTGTTTQGVVSYMVKVGFDTQDSRIKPGMSVSAAIITDVKTDALLVPNSAVKGNSQNKTVQVLVNGSPISKNIQVGLSNDSQTEVSGDITEGDEVVTQTITAATQSATPNTQRTGSVLPFGGGGGGRAGGGLR